MRGLVGLKTSWMSKGVEVIASVYSVSTFDALLDNVDHSCITHDSSAVRTRTRVSERRCESCSCGQGSE